MVFHAPKDTGGACACGWSSRAATHTRREQGLQRHMEAARTRGDIVASRATSSYDDTDSHRSLSSLVMRVTTGLVSGPAGFALALAATVAFTVVALGYARAQIHGVLFAVVSGVVIFGILIAVSIAAEVLLADHGAAVFGPPIAGPNSTRRRIVLLALRCGRASEYRFDPVVQQAVDQYEAVDRRVLHRKTQEGDEAMIALLQFADPATKDTMVDALRTHDLEVGSALSHFGAVGTLVGRLAGLAFPLLGVLAVLDAEGRIARVTLVQVAIGFVLFAAVLAVIVVQARLSEATIWVTPEHEAEATGREREALAMLANATVHPKVFPQAGFYSAVRQYLLLLHVPIVLVNLAVIGVLFAVIGVVTALWPGRALDWNGQLPEAFLVLAGAGIAYVVSLAAALAVIDRLRFVYQPVAVSLLAEAAGALVIYALTGSASVSTVASALPAALLTAMATPFGARAASAPLPAH